ncbi:MAG TPA: hypothetical protein VLA23_01410 [Candidatus Limnocylindrales bacterium]|nr:hypothetical protein [Candidatus Limnocylindrales bacterium]
MRFQDAAPDARAVVYQNIQADPLVARAAELLADGPGAVRILARAVMNGESVEPERWRTMFPGLFGPGADAADRERAEAVLDVSLRVADRGEQARSQFRGAIVEALTELLLRRRTPDVRRERRVLFDGVRAQVHPYDVTVETVGAAEVLDCKWGARGINGEVLLQLDDARTHAEAEGARVRVALVVFDAYRSCLVRLARETAPADGTRLATIETIGDLATRPAALRARR